LLEKAPLVGKIILGKIVLKNEMMRDVNTLIITIDSTKTTSPN
jgi:hypothetical protein